MKFIRKKKDKKKEEISSAIARKFLMFYQLLICALIIAGVMFSSIAIVNKNDEVEKMMISHSKILKNIMKNEINQIEYQLNYASSKISLISNNYSKIDQLLSSLSSTANTNISLSWNSYSWINKDDKIAIDGKLGILKNKPDVSRRDYLRFTKFKQTGAVLGSPIYGAISRRYIIPVAIGTFRGESQYLGTLVFGLDVDKIKEKMNSEINDKKVSFLIFKEGSLLFYSGDITESVISHIEDKAKILSLEEGDLETKLTNQGLFFGDGYISVFKKDDNFPIEVAVIYDSKHYSEQITNLIIEKMLIVLLLAILFFILFKILYLRIIKPVSHLSQFAKQISRKDFNTNIQKPLNKELNEIYDSLNLISQSFSKEESMKKQLIDINKKLAAENASKNEFFQAICHDIRSPIFSISNDVKTLGELTKNKEVQTIISNFNENVTDMLQLTEDLLDISRTSSGSINVDKKSKTEVVEVINRSIKICSSFAKKRGVTIKNATDKEINKIKLDSKRLRQILVNILTKLTVTSKKESAIKISVEEFSSENQDKLRIYIRSSSDHLALDKETDEYKENMKKFGMLGSDVNDLNAGLKHTKDLIGLMGGTFEMEIKKKESCLIKITFNY